MSTNIKLKRSSVAGNVPTTSQLSLGELAINTADGAVYSKKSDNSIFPIHDSTIMQLNSTTKSVNISRLDSRLKTPDGDNSISNLTTFGKLIKLATIDIGAVGEYYRVNLDMYLTEDESGKPVRSYVSIQQNDAFGNNPDRVLFNISDDDRDITQTKYPEIVIRFDNDASSGNAGTGPTRVELWAKIRTEGSGVEVFVKDEVFSSSDVTATWITSYAETDYHDITDYGSSGLPNGNTGTVAHGHSTESENWNSLFGSNPGVAITDGGRTRSAISVITPGEGFLRNDGGASGGTYSYTYDMVPEAASTTLTIGRTDQDATGIITLGRSTATNTINIGNAVTADGATQTINIGGSNATGGDTVLNLAANTNIASDTAVTIGNSNSTGTMTVAIRGATTFSNGVVDVEDAFTANSVASDTTLATGSYILPNSAGSAGQVLAYPSANSTLEWVYPDVDQYSFAKSLGWVPGLGDNTNSRVEWSILDSAVNFVPTGTATMGLVHTAFKVFAGQKVHITLPVKASSSGPSSGLFIKVYQHNGDLPNGKTHVADTSVGTSSTFIQDDDAVYSILNNSGVSNSWINYTGEVTPTQDCYMSIGLYVSTSTGTTQFRIKQPKITFAGLTKLDAIAMQYVFG
jgi:hypothetical protein